MPKFARASAVVALGGLLAAQGFVSPRANAGTEGNSASAYPFGHDDMRWQEVHADPRGTPLAITRLAWRRDCETATSTTYGPRTFDLEFFAGGGSLASFGTAFASNYDATTPSTRVVARRTLNLPDLNPLPATPPAPFTVVLPFDAPYPHLGTRDLVIEAITWGNSAGPGYQLIPLDHVSPVQSMPGSSAIVGTGCFTGASATSPMALAVSSSVNASRTLTSTWSVLRAPPNATGNLLLIGLTNPGVQVPGLCTALHSDALVLLPGPGASSTGNWTVANVTFPMSQAMLGAKLYAQAASPDASKTIPVALSNGREWTLPAAFPAPVAVKRTLTWNRAAITGSAVQELGGVIQIL